MTALTLEQIIAEMRAVPATVPYDILLNDLGWEMNSFLTNNGATFDGRVFNNMKGFIKQMIEKWVTLSSDPAILNALSEAATRAVKAEDTIERLEIEGRELRQFSIDYAVERDRATKAEAELFEANNKLVTRDRELRVAEAERDAAVEALKPFGSFDTEDFPDEMRAFDDNSTLTIGHFRRARSIIAKEPTAPLTYAQYQADGREWDDDGQGD